MSHQDALPYRLMESALTGSQLTTCMSPGGQSSLLFDEDQRIADWCAMRMPHFSGWGTRPSCIGLERDRKLRAGVVYTNYSRGNVFASIVIDGRMNRQFLHAIFFNPFIAWGVRHITCTIEDENLKSIKLCTHLGFKECGRLRQAAFNGGDIIILGMLKSECRWL